MATGSPPRGVNPANPDINTPKSGMNIGADDPGGMDSAGEDPDLELVESIRSGERSGWTRLIQRYQDRLFSVCLRLVHDRELAADLTQDAFVKVIQGLNKYDGRSKLSTWMIRVTMNVCLSKLRSEKLRRHASLDAMSAGWSGGNEDAARGVQFAAEESTTREHGTGSGVIEDEDRRLVLRALQLLEPDQRAVLILRDAQDLEYEQIAEVLGVAVGTVKSRLFRARAALRSEMEKLGAGISDENGDHSPGSGNAQGREA